MQNEVEILKKQIEALKELVAIKDQIIAELKAKNSQSLPVGLLTLDPIVNPNIRWEYIPQNPPPLQPPFIVSNDCGIVNDELSTRIPITITEFLT